MKLNLEGKLAVVTGSSAGIGRSIAAMLHENGANVVLNGRSIEKLKKIQDELSQKGSKNSVQAIEADLGTAEGCEKFIKAVPACDILVNNMGIYFPKPFEELTDQDWNRIWEVNVMSSVRLSRYYLAGMRKKNWGRFIFISSESALQTPVEMIHYGVSKTAMNAVARGIAEATAGTKITSNSIIVGPTYSEGVEVFIEDMAKSKGITPEEASRNFFKDIRPSSLIKRFITTDEVANLVTFLCGEEAAAIDGSAIRVDGGVVKTIV